jgi:hypothetical protein
MKLQTLAVLVALVLVAPVPAAAEDEEAPNFLLAFMKDLVLGEGQPARDIIIFPVLAPKKPDALAVKPDVWSSKVAFSEPDFPKRRFNVGVRNNEADPLLVLGGTVLGGGRRDRLVPSDVLVPAGGDVEIRTIVASAPQDSRKDPIPFKIADQTAPPFLRERAEFSPTNTLAPAFVSQFLDFRVEGDKRRSLLAIMDSDQLMSFCIPCHERLSAFPTASGGRVVGFMTAVRGRIRSLEFFGSNRLFKAYFSPLLKSHTFAAAAIALRAKKLNLPVPGKGDPQKALKEARVKAEKLLAQVKRARFRDGDAPKGSMGEYLVLRTPNSTRGTAVALNGRLVHASIHPYEPFENALFRGQLEPPPEGTEYDAEEGIGPLERRAGRGGLTEAERRLLERMRRNRAGIGGLRRK